MPAGQRIHHHAFVLHQSSCHHARSLVPCSHAADERPSHAACTCARPCSAALHCSSACPQLTQAAIHPMLPAPLLTRAALASTTLLHAPNFNRRHYAPTRLWQFHVPLQTERRHRPGRAAAQGMWPFGLALAHRLRAWDLRLSYIDRTGLRAAILRYCSPGERRGLGTALALADAHSHVDAQHSPDIVRRLLTRQLHQRGAAVEPCWARYATRSRGIPQRHCLLTRYALNSPFAPDVHGSTLTSLPHDRPQ